MMLLSSEPKMNYLTTGHFALKVVCHVDNVTNFLLILPWKRRCDKNMRPIIVIFIAPDLAESRADPKDGPIPLELYQDVVATKLVLNEPPELQHNQRCFIEVVGITGH